MRFARLVPILLSGAALGAAWIHLPIVPSAEGLPFLGAARIAGGSSAISLVALTPGDELQIAVESDGCFHHFRFRLTIHRDDLGAKVWLNSAEANLVPGSMLALTRTRLDQRDLMRLDALFSYYRMKRRGGCTTVESIDLESNRRGVVRRESYVDASCATYDDPTVLTISSLVSIQQDTVTITKQEETGSSYVFARGRAPSVN